MQAERTGFSESLPAAVRRLQQTVNLKQLRDTMNDITYYADSLERQCSALQKRYKPLLCGCHLVVLQSLSASTAPYSDLLGCRNMINLSCLGEDCGRQPRPKLVASDLPQIQSSSPVGVRLSILTLRAEPVGPRVMIVKYADCGDSYDWNMHDCSDSIVLSDYLITARSIDRNQLDGIMPATDPDCFF